MKYLPCDTCRAPALATRGGILHTAGQLSSPSVRILCARCGRTTIVTARALASQPELSREEIAADTCDLPANS